MDGNIVLIASYPKSGNTWARMVLQALVSGEVPDVNSIDGTYYGPGRRQIFDDLAPAPAADLLPHEIDLHMPSIYAAISRIESSRPLLIKSHEMARRNTAGDWIFPPGNVRAVCYLVRHPFDVAVSWAHHTGGTIEQGVQSMIRPHTLSNQRSMLPLGLPEPMGTWSQNVSSWTAPDLPYSVHVVRYEDLLDDPCAEFSGMATAAGISASPQQISTAVDSTRFERLREQEERSGFRERPKTSPRFFRAGGVRSWEGILTPALQRTLIEAHGPIMEKLGYSSDGKVLPRK